MKILISHLPKNKWWGHGTPIYKDNPAMKQGLVPNQELVEIERYIMTQLFNRLPFEVVEVDFPRFLDKQNLDQRQDSINPFHLQGIMVYVLYLLYLKSKILKFDHFLEFL